MGGMVVALQSAMLINHVEKTYANYVMLLLKIIITRREFNFL